MKLIENISAITKEHGRIAVAEYLWDNKIWIAVVKVPGKWNEKTQLKYWKECEEQMIRRIDNDTYTDYNI